ncbi:hypothetical protein [Allorhizocola rhizosphaerae]|uniref:hypothetical protein n=1 Tax=Allorhizocola rhizosphaerae TaxID=1872709 RepID=UPI0013C324A1|nr:hypothetical protein [Allorhizocola rhizosphaerae]
MFTDEELAFLRHVRFGELPQPVRPEDYVATVETEAPMEELNTEPWQHHSVGYAG